MRSPAKTTHSVQLKIMLCYGTCWTKQLWLEIFFISFTYRNITEYLSHYKLTLYNGGTQTAAAPLQINSLLVYVLKNVSEQVLKNINVRYTNVSLKCVNSSRLICCRILHITIFEVLRMKYVIVYFLFTIKLQYFNTPTTNNIPSFPTL